MCRGLHIRWYHYRHHFYLRNLCHTTKKSNLCHSVLYRNNHQFWMHREFVIQLDLISRLFQEDRIVLRFSNLLFSPVFLLKMVKNIIDGTCWIPFSGSLENFQPNLFHLNQKIRFVFFVRPTICGWNDFESELVVRCPESFLLQNLFRRFCNRNEAILRPELVIWIQIKIFL